MTDQIARLDRLGDALQAAATADLAGSGSRASRLRRTRVRRRLLIALAVLVISVPAIAFAADRLISAGTVAASMPAGTLALAGTQPTCTVVKQNVEFHCVLQKQPSHEVDNWKGTVEPTVDTSESVNGGCRGLRSDGLEWECYLGQTAVDEGIIGQSFLGQKVSGPGSG